MRGGSAPRSNPLPCHIPFWQKKYPFYILFYWKTVKQCSDWRTINSGAPQGSALGPLLFLIYINDITDDLAALPLIYADDTTLLETVDDTAVSAGRLNSDWNKIAVWADKWLVTMNPVKSRNVVFSLKRNKQVHPPLFLNSNKVKDAESRTHLGLTLQSSMSCRNHIAQVYEKASKRC